MSHDSHFPLGKLAHGHRLRGDRLRTELLLSNESVQIVKFFRGNHVTLKLSEALRQGQSGRLKKLLALRLQVVCVFPFLLLFAVPRLRSHKDAQNF